MVYFCFVTIDAFDRWTDRQTDRQTDRIVIARPHRHSMQRGKKRFFSEKYPETQTIRKKTRSSGANPAVVTLYITGWAVALSCYISHSIKHRKRQISTPQVGSQTPVPILMKLGIVDYVWDPTPHNNFGGGSTMWVVWAHV